jgi:hypothetical protein
MKTHQLSFGTANLHDDGIIELRADSDIEVTQKMTDEVHHFLKDHVKEHCGLLVERKHQVAYTFDAMQEFGASKHIAAVAIVTYTDTARLAAESLKTVARKNCEIGVFSSKPVAHQWLQQQLSISKNPPAEGENS